MFAIHALYHGRSRRRADYIRDVADALAATSAVDDVRIYGADGFAVSSSDSDGATTVILNLLQAGDFSVGIGAVIGRDLAHEADQEPTGNTDYIDQSFAAAGRAFARPHRAGTVQTRIEVFGLEGAHAPGTPREFAEDVTAVFTLLAHVLSRRTPEGREATALMRQGHLQTEASEQLGISKQAMSQRLTAAGWQAEQAGWTLAVHMLRRVSDVL